MTWLLAAAYVGAAAVAFAGIALRADPRVLDRLGLPRPGSRGSPSPSRVRRALLGRDAARTGASGSACDLIDLMAVAVGAGLSPRLALERAAVAVPGPVGDQVGVARRDVELGAPWRDALRAAAERTGMSELRRLASILDRGDRLGSPLSGTLRSFARQVREERRVAQEERARRAPVVMLFPLVLCILPAFVLSALVPALIVAAKGLT